MLLFGAVRAITVAIVFASIFFESSFAALAFAQDIVSPIPVSACWNHKSDGTIVSVRSDTSRVFIAKDEARVEALSSVSGERLWTTDLGGEVISNIVASTGQVFVSTRSNSDAGSTNTIRSISSTTGITNWAVPSGGAGHVFLGVSGANLLAVSADGNLSSIALINGRSNWIRNISVPITAGPVIYGYQLFFGTGDKKVRLVSATDGIELVDIRVAHEATALVLDDTNAYWGDGLGNVFAYNIAEGSYRWQSRLGGKIIDLILSDQGLICASADNFVYMISLRGGDRKWKRRLENRITALSEWNHEFILVLDTSGEQVDVLDIRRGRLLSQVAALTQQFTIIQGAADKQALFVTPEIVSSYQLGGCGQK